jgi:hypothetical protein
VFLLRVFAVLALMFWIGGLVALGAFTAPTLFEILQARDAAGGRELAGQLFGTMLGRFQIAGSLAGGVVILSLTLRALLGPRPRWFFLRLWTSVAMVAASIVSVLVIAPRIDAIRQSVKGPVAALADDDARKTAFGQLHGLSTGLMLFTMVAGIGLVYTEVRDH